MKTFLLTLGLCLLLAAPIQAAQRVALVIGNNAYEHADRLFNPLNDARAVAAALGRLGFAVTTLEDARKAALEEGLIQFRDSSRGADLALLFYAGHAVQVDNRNYLVPVDARVKELGDVSIRLVTLNSALEQMRGQVNVVILDACRDNPFADDLNRSAARLGRSLGASRGLIREEAALVGSHAYLMMAASSGKAAVDGPPGGHSPYTAALLEHLETQNLDIRFLHARVRQTVEQNTGRAQSPEAIDRLPDHFIYFAPSGTGQASQPAEQPPVAPPVTPPSSTQPPVIQQQPQQVAMGSRPTAPSGPKAGEVWKEPYTGMEFVWVPGGCFQMGCGEWNSECDEGEKPVHEVCLDGFWIGKYEVTQAQWEKVMGSNPTFDFLRYPNYPVDNVSWNDTQMYIGKLNIRSTALGLRLPTEAEWEYACRGGGRQEKYCGGNDVVNVAWHSGNLGYTTVGSKSPNALGIYDMSGNVAEWVSDWYDSDYYDQSPKMNPQGPSSGTRRVFRGGNFSDEASECRAAFRSAWPPDNWLNLFKGFRLALSLGQQ